MGRIYAAYGSNLNIKQMKRRCPTAKLLGSSMPEGWQLEFRGEHGGAVATIMPRDGSIVPLLLWDIQLQDEKALDRYEGYPRLYKKAKIYVDLDGKEKIAFIYLMTLGRDLGKPHDLYYKTIKDGYIKAGFDVSILDRAVKISSRGEKR